MVRAAPEPSSPPVVVMPSMQGGRPRDLPRPFPVRTPAVGDKKQKPAFPSLGDSSLKSPEPAIRFSAPAFPTQALMSPESLDLDPPMSTHFPEETPMLDEEPGDLPDLQEQFPVAQLPGAAKSEKKPAQEEEPGPQKKPAQEEEPGPQKKPALEEEPQPEGKLVIEEESPRVEEKSSEEKKTWPKKEALPLKKPAKKPSPAKPEPADITLQRHKLASLKLAAEAPAVEDVAVSLDRILEKPGGLSSLKFELERRGYSLFSGDELRQLKLEVRRRVESETRQPEIPQTSTKDKIQASWRSAKPAALSTDAEDEWMAQPRQLVIGGKVLTFDLRVRSEDVSIPAPRVPRRKKPAVKKEPVDITIDSKGAEDTPIILE